MNEGQLRREQEYRVAMILAQELRNKGSISDEDFRNIECFMAARFRPVLGGIIGKIA